MRDVETCTPKLHQRRAVATYQKRGATWRASVARQGQRVTATFDTRAQAEAWAQATEAAILAPTTAGIVAGVTLTVAVLFERYAREVSPSKAGERWEVLRLRALPRDFSLFAGPMADLTPEALATWRATRLAQVSAHTVNRELNVISAVLQHALKEWRTPGLASNPVRAIKRPPIPAPRQQRVRAADRAAVLAALGWDGAVAPAVAGQWTAWAFVLALETAMRKGEVLRLTWGHVHLEERRLHLPKTKNGHPRDVPLSSAASALVAMLTPGEPNAAVVPVESGNLDKLFRAAKTAAGVPHIRFHDARREALTMMAPKLSVLELAGVSGHRSLNTLLNTYYAPDAGDLAKKLG